MIKAYHQIGSDSWTPEERVAAFDEISAIGEILPASMRLEKQWAYGECSESLPGHFPEVPSKVMVALKEMVSEVIRELPESGLERTLLTCTDLLANDHQFVFLSPLSWWRFANGFVFDAEELLHNGALFRPQDILGEYWRIIQEGKYTGKNVKEIKAQIKSAIKRTQRKYQRSGVDAIIMLKEWLKAPYRSRVIDGLYWNLRAEILWPGTLSLETAIEAWRDGSRVR